MGTLRKLAGDWIALLFVVALVYVLVRPQSAGADLVDQFSTAMTAMVKAATGMAEGA